MEFFPPTRGKKCFVPGCKNKSTAGSKKLFFSVPKGEVRKQWYLTVGRAVSSLVSYHTICEDHFTLEDDVENLHSYISMQQLGFGSSKVKLKNGVLPTKFACRIEKAVADGSTANSLSNNVSSTVATSSNTSTPLNVEKPSLHNLMLPTSLSTTIDSSFSQEVESPSSLVNISPIQPTSSENVLNGLDVGGCDESYLMYDHMISTPAPKKSCHSTPSIFSDSSSDIHHTSHVEHVLEATPKIRKYPLPICKKVIMKDAACQVYLLGGPTGSLWKKNTADASCQARPYFRSQCVGTPSPKLTESSTSPMKTRKRARDQDLDSTMTSMCSSLPENISADSSFAVYEVPSNYSEESEIAAFKDALSMEALKDLNIKLMEKYPKVYFGLSDDAVCILPRLAKFTSKPIMYLMLVLRKIKLNESFEILGHVFNVSKQRISQILDETAPVMAAFLKSFIKWPSPTIIKSNVPTAFRMNFSDIQSIIDCFEVQTEKPGDPIAQSRFWSEYKKCNTVKFLISCTPDGLINFISPGYGGRSSDVAIVKHSGYLAQLPVRAIVMADRGFKHVADAICAKNCHLVRPPSVEQGVKMSESDVKLTKIVASLRIHVERVIGRVREFQFFDPHACFHHDLQCYVNHFIVIACALCNLQGPLIR